MARYVIFRVDGARNELGYLNEHGEFAPDTSNPQLFGSSQEADEVVRTKLADGKFDLDAFRTTQSEQRASQPLRFLTRESPSLRGSRNSAGGE